MGVLMVPLLEACMRAASVHSRVELLAVSADITRWMKDKTSTELTAGPDSQGHDIAFAASLDAQSFSPARSDGSFQGFAIHTRETADA